MKMMKSIGLAFIALVLITGSTGCAGRKLAADGPYQGDRVLFETEKAIVLAHENFRGFLTWEMTNRTVLPKEISRAADFIRQNEQRWITSANAAHDAYVRTPGDPNAKDKLQLAMNLLQTALREAAAYMLAGNTVAPNQGLKNVKPVTEGGQPVLPGLN